MTRLDDDDGFDKEEEKDVVPVLKQASLAPSSARRYATTDSGTGSSSRNRLSNITSTTNPTGGGEQPDLIELDEAEDLANIHQTLRDPNINKLNILDSLYEGTFRGKTTFKG